MDKVEESVMKVRSLSEKQGESFEGEQSTRKWNGSSL